MSKLKALALATILAVGAVAASSDSYAGGRGGWHGGGGHGWHGGGWRGGGWGGRGYYRGGGWGRGAGWGVAAGILGLGVGAALASPYYGYSPGPLPYYGSYPYPYRPYCVGYCPY